MLRSDRTGRAISVAVSAIEQALWDVAGKLLETPLYRLLGGAGRTPAATACAATPRWPRA